jgi:hypothetical protein
MRPDSAEFSVAGASAALKRKLSPKDSQPAIINVARPAGRKIRALDDEGDAIRDSARAHNVLDRKRRGSPRSADRARPSPSARGGFRIRTPLPISSWEGALRYSAFRACASSRLPTIPSLS